VQFVLGIDAAIAAILLALLMRRKHRLRADRWLMLALAVLIVTAIGLALNSRSDPPPPVLLPLAIFVGGSSFFISPIALYLYARDVTGRFRLADLVWFAPPVVHMVWMLWEAYFGGGAVFVHGFAGVVTDGHVMRRILAPLSVLFTLLFPGFALIEIARFRASIKRYVSNMDGVDLSWVRAVLWSVIAGGLLGAVLIGLAANHIWIGLEQASALIMLVIGLQLGTSGYYALFQREPPHAEDSRATDAETIIDLTACERDFADLNRLMRSNHLYRQDSFRLEQLADAMGWPRYRVGEALLHAGKTSFFDFVNGFRVEEASTLLADRANASVSVLALAFDAGFQSKASFNRIFKQQTGVTPSDYRRRNMSGSDSAASG
jgi:AraC-like DNA-binding protein